MKFKINMYSDNLPDSMPKKFQTDIPIFIIFPDGLKLPYHDMLTAWNLNWNEPFPHVTNSAFMPLE